MILRCTILALFVSLLCQLVDSSSCGPAAIPFSFESLPDGQPVLGCSRPKCFGWKADSKAAGSPSTFFRINNKPDGYFRKNTDGLPQQISEQDGQYFKPQIAVSYFRSMQKYQNLANLANLFQFLLRATLELADVEFISFDWNNNQREIVAQRISRLW